MPTAAKMVAALAMALSMFLAAEASKAGLPQGTPAAFLNPIVAGIGFLCGWMVLGGLVGQGYGASIGYGLRTAVTAAFWALLVFSLWKMLQLSVRKRFDGPVEAILGVFGIMADYAKLVILPNVLAALGGGGVVAGILAEFFGRRFR